MQIELKNLIIDALEIYLSAHAMSQNEVAKKANVNAAYLVNMRKREFEISGVSIKDIYFHRIAEFINYEIESPEIGIKLTRQFKFILANLNLAREHAESAVLIGETGAGKTYTVDIFKKHYPSDVFSIKVGASDSLTDIINKLASELKMDFLRVLKSPSSKSSKIGFICRKLQQMKDSGLQPVIIFDEAEYMKHHSLCTFKELYDVLIGVCSTVLIGTPELTNNIEKLIRKNTPGVAQLFRRIKFKTKRIPSIDTKYELFLEGIEPELAKWLRANCNNYGELTDVLKPCLRESRRIEKPLTLDFVKTVLGL